MKTEVDKNYQLSRMLFNPIYKWELEKSDFN